MFRTMNVYAYGINRLIFLLPKLREGNKLVAEKKFNEADNKIMKPYVATSVATLLKKAGVRVDVNGSRNLPKNETYVLISNHQGNFDAIVLMHAMNGKRFGFLSKKEIAKINILKVWMDFIGCIFIDRKNPKLAIKSLMDAETNIKNGTCMAFFPEGTRSRKSKIGTFKTGVFKVIEKTRVKVVPVSIDGTYRVMEDNNGKIKPANVTVTFGKPIDTKDFQREDFKKLPEQVKEIIQKNMRFAKK